MTAEAVHALLIHDIEVHRLTKDVTLDAETYRSFTRDGLASWNFFDNKISADKRLYPVKKSLADYGVIAKKDLEEVKSIPSSQNVCL